MEVARRSFDSGLLDQRAVILHRPGHSGWQGLVMCTGRVWSQNVRIWLQVSIALSMIEASTAEPQQSAECQAEQSLPGMFSSTRCATGTHMLCVSQVMRRHTTVRVDPVQVRCSVSAC